MKINDNLRRSLALAQNPTVITEETYKKLLENTFSVLTGKEEVHSVSKLYNSKPDIVKEFYAALLSASAEFARTASSREDIFQLLTNACSFTSARANAFVEAYERNKQGLEIALLNIGSHLPHVTDVKWKIDYIVKSSVADQSDGPLFRISLMAERYDEETEEKKARNVNFTCTSQELQDLVYKLKDAVRHCSFSHRIL